jgi:hypothetical protein
MFMEMALCSCDVEIFPKDMETILQEDEHKKLHSLTYLNKIFARNQRVSCLMLQHDTIPVV